VAGGFEYLIPRVIFFAGLRIPNIRAGCLLSIFAIVNVEKEVRFAGSAPCYVFVSRDDFNFVRALEWVFRVPLDGYRLRDFWIVPCRFW
jgi:hypothetical protein